MSARVRRSFRKAACRIGSVLLIACAVAAGRATIRGADVEAVARALATLAPSEYAEELTWWAADEREGREPGTPGSIQAGDRAAADFARLGLAPAGDVVDGAPTWFQTLEEGGKQGLFPDARLAVGDAVFELGKDWTYVGGAREVELDGVDVVFAGYGITAPEYDYDDFAGVEATGKAVLVLRYEPQEKDPASRWRGTEATEHAPLQAKLENARKHGATAVLVVNGPLHHHPESDRLSDLTLGFDSGGNSGVLHVRDSVASALLAPLGRTLLDLQKEIDEKAAPASRPIEGVKLRLAARGGQVVKARNVMGLLEGSDNELKREVIVVGAHYDHVGRGAYGSMAPHRAGEVHNGADDNASGSVGVIELAEALVEGGLRPKRSVLFQLYDAEEKGLVGSRYWTEHPTVPLDRIVAMLNLDMIGGVNKLKCTIFAADTAAEWRAIIDRAREGSPLEVQPSGDVAWGSDHVSFAAKQVPVLFFTSGMHKPYHTPDDDVGICDPPSSVRILELALRILVEVADRDGRLAFQAGQGGPSPRRVRRGLLGIRMEEAAGDVPGVRVADVVQGSAAEKAGLRKGDLILWVGDVETRAPADLMRAVGGRKRGDEVRLRYLRGDEGFEVSAKLGAP